MVEQHESFSIRPMSSSNLSRNCGHGPGQHVAVMASEREFPQQAQQRVRLTFPAVPSIDRSGSSVIVLQHATEAFTALDFASD